MDIKHLRVKQNPYSSFFSAFSQKEQNKGLTFSEKSVKASQEWQSLNQKEKSIYKVEKQREENHARMSKHNENICGKCGRNFKAAFRLRYHIKTCGNVESKCPCKKIFKSQEGLKKHMRFVHSKEKLHTCPRCNKQFICRADLKAHYNIHEGIRFSCGQCDSTFSNMSNKLKHCKNKS